MNQGKLKIHCWVHQRNRYIELDMGVWNGNYIFSLPKMLFDIILSSWIGGSWCYDFKEFYYYYVLVQTQDKTCNGCFRRLKLDQDIGISIKRYKIADSRQNWNSRRSISVCRQRNSFQEVFLLWIRHSFFSGNSFTAFFAVVDSLTKINLGRKGCIWLVYPVKLQKWVFSSEVPSSQMTLAMSSGQN